MPVDSSRSPQARFLFPESFVPLSPWFTSHVLAGDSRILWSHLGYARIDPTSVAVTPANHGVYAAGPCRVLCSYLVCGEG